LQNIDINDLLIVKVVQKSVNKDTDTEALIYSSGTGMTTYFPLPLRSDDKYKNIYGATKVIYGSDGKPQLSKEGYRI